MLKKDEPRTKLYIQPKKSEFMPEHGAFCKVSDWKAGAALPCMTCKHEIVGKDYVSCSNEERVYWRKSSS